MGWSRGGLWLPPLLVVVMHFISLKAHADSVTVAPALKFVKVPRQFSASPSATFQLQVTGGRNDDLCSNCRISCKLDNNIPSNCVSRRVTYTGLLDGNHSFEACANESQRIRCVSYNWTVDTLPPTAYVSAASSFTNSLNVTIHVSFSEPCTGGGGFRCSSDICNLLIYGAGHVLPSTLKVLQPDLEFSLVVAINADIQYGRLVIVMDKSFCEDNAGNRFKRAPNSTFILHFDRRNVFMNLTTHVPKKLLQLNGQIRTVEATNAEKGLKVYLSFSEPILNTSKEILSVLHINSGSLASTKRNNLGNRRFGYLVHNISNMAIVTITCDTDYIISRQGTPISQSNPVTFLYDAERPSVRLSTTSSMRTREHIIPVLINFMKPVFDFNSSAIIISGGYLQSFHEINKSLYTIKVQANGSTISVDVPENSAADVAGNKNLPSNHLQVRHYSIPTISTLVSLLATIALLTTSTVAALLTVSSASFLSSGAFSKHSAYFVSEPSRNLLRIMCHIQIFALSRWLAFNMPIEFDEFARGIGWTIPYLHLPWENGSNDPYWEGSSVPFGTYSDFWEKIKWKAFEPSLATDHKLDMEPFASGTPLTAAEYRSFFENQNLKPEAEYIVISQNSNKWKYFGRNMFWLAAIGGGLVVLHIAILCILKFRGKRSESEKHKEYGAVVFPRFEIFLMLLALPCISQASAAVIKGGTIAGIVVGIVLLGVSTSFLVSLLLFLSLGITMGKLLQYKEVHQEGQEFHWYQEFIRITLGPGKRGQWTWKDQQNSVNLTKLGPLFEDLRGPPKYMLTQISGGENLRKREDRIIASEDENEDAEAPFIQKLFGILRIYYTFLESVKRVSLGIIAGAHSSHRPSKIPTLIILCITSFQLFSLLLKKPFIKKKVQFVEIISVACEVSLFGACLYLLENEFPGKYVSSVGYFMLALFIVGFVTQLVNEWYALYQQVQRMSPAGNSFSSGLKTALGGLILILHPARLLTEFNEQLSSSTGDGASGFTISPSGQTQRSSGSGTGERSWLRQLRELAKASFSREDAGVPNDPSSSTHQRSGFWSGKRSRSSSVTSSTDFKAKGDFKAKSRGLYKDLEAIFSAK